MSTMVQSQSPTSAKLQQLLDRLSQNPLQTLRESGVKGVRGDCTRCAVARWLHREMCKPIFVTPYAVDCHYEEGKAEILPLANSIYRFIIDFDSGIYPDLVEQTQNVDS